MLIIQFLVPILQIALFCLCVGRKLTDVPVGLVSREAVRSGSVTELIFNKIDRSVLNLVGLLTSRLTGVRVSFEQIEYPSLNEAQQQLNLGFLAGIFDVGANFSRELFEKIQHW